MSRSDSGLLWQRAKAAVCLAAILFNPLAALAQSPQNAAKQQAPKTETPIKHVIVLIGENRTFDHIFATYVPQKHATVSNLLSKGIIKADGTPGPNFKKSQQFQAIPPFRAHYYVSLHDDEKAPYKILPQPTLNFAPTATVFPPGTPDAFLALVEPSLELADEHLLTTGAATGFSQTFVQPDPDTRIQNFDTLPNGPFPLAGAKLPYDSYTGDTTHRLYEMWQQSDCSIEHATRHNPSGCLSDLYPFVGVARNDGSGSNSMGFYNMHNGDAPVFKRIAEKYTINDNYHQPVMGGTAVQHIMLGTADAIFLE